MDAPPARGMTVNLVLRTQRAQINFPAIKPRQQLQRHLTLGLAPAAMLGIERKFVDNVRPRERLLRAAAQMWLPLLDHAAVLQRRADMTGIVVRVGVVEIGR